jgi:hypothetical protein
MLAILGQYVDFITGHGFPSQKRLAADAGIDRHEVGRLLRAAAAFGYLDVETLRNNHLVYRYKDGPLMLFKPAPLGRATVPTPLVEPQYQGLVEPQYQDLGRATVPTRISTSYQTNDDVASASALLRKHGVEDGQVAEIWLAGVTPEAVRDQVDALPYRKNIENPAASLYCACLRGYVLPKGLLRARGRAAALAAQLELHAATELERRRESQDDRTPEELRAVARANMPEFIRRKVSQA